MNADEHLRTISDLETPLTEDLWATSPRVDSGEPSPQPADQGKQWTVLDLNTQPEGSRDLSRVRCFLGPLLPGRPTLILLDRSVGVRPCPGVLDGAGYQHGHQRAVGLPLQARRRAPSGARGYWVPTVRGVWRTFLRTRSTGDRRVISASFGLLKLRSHESLAGSRTGSEMEAGGGLLSRWSYASGVPGQPTTTDPWSAQASSLTASSRRSTMSTGSASTHTSIGVPIRTVTGLEVGSARPLGHTP